MRGGPARPLLLVVVGLWVLCTTWSPAGAGPRQTSADPSIGVAGQTTMVAPEDEFRLDVAVENAPPGSTITTRLYGRLGDQSEFGPATLGVGLGNPIHRAQRPVEEAVPAADGDRVLPLRLNLCSLMCGPEDILLSNDGVYPYDVRLTGPDGEELGRLITFVVRLPDEPWTGTPLRAAVLLGLHAPPALAPGRSPTLDEQAMSSIEVLTQALLDHPEVPVTVVPTPETMASLSGSDPDRLDRLSLALGDENRQVIAGPYVDVPLAAWLDAGLTEELAALRARGTDVLQDLLPDPDVRTWVADPTLTVGAAARLQEMGVGQVVVDPAGLVPSDAATGSPPVPLTRRFSVDTGTIDGLSAVQIDPRLRAAFDRTGDVLAAHLLLAELAVIAYEEADGERGVVIAPPEGWTPSATFLDVLLDGLAVGDPLVRASTVEDLFAGIAAEAPGGGPAEGETSRSVGLAPAPATPLGAYPERLAASRRLLDSYRSFIGDANRLIDPFDERLLISAAEDLSPEDRLELLSQIDASVLGAFEEVEVATQQTVTLTSTEGQLPVTIRNPLDHRVEVVVTLSSSERLEFKDGGVQGVRLEAGETRSLQFGVRARATGDTPVQVVVRTPDGAQLVEATRYNVRSMAVSGVGVLLSVGAAGFLALWWLRHIRLVRRERRLIRDEAAASVADGAGPPATPATPATGAAPASPAAGADGGATATGVPSAVD